MEDHLIEKNNGLNGQIDLDETEDQGSDSFVTPLAQYKPHDGHLGLRRRRTNVSYSEDDHQHQETHIQNKDDLYRLEQLDLTSLDLTRLQQLEPMSVSDIYFESFYRLEQLVPMPLIQRPSDSPLISKFLNCVSFGGPMADKIYGYLKKIEPQLFYKPVQDGHFGLRRRRNYNLSSPLGATLDLISWLRDDDSLLNRLIDLGEVDVVSQMIKAAAGTDCNLNLGTASVVTARHTEQRITPSSLLPNTPHRINIKEGNSNDEEVHGKRQGWSQKMDFEWIFVITNIVLESMSAVFTQLYSKQKPQYALFGMLLSYLALLTCLIELIYEHHRHQQIPIWRRRRRGTWCYYRPHRGKSFATLNNIVALACALAQCVVTTINYRFESLIKLTVSPIILANGVLFSKILKYRERSTL